MSAGTASRRVSAGLMCDPDLLARPPLRPLGRHEIEAWLRGWGRSNLDEIVDHEAGCPEQSDPMPVREMKLDAPMRFELHAIPFKVVSNEAVPTGPPSTAYTSAGGRCS